MNERSSTTRVAMKGREERMFFDSLSLRESSIIVKEDKSSFPSSLSLRESSIIVKEDKSSFPSSLSLRESSIFDSFFEEKNQ